jgi:Rieske Fe-S protein
MAALGVCGCSSSGVSDTPPAPAGSYRLSDGKVILDLSKVSDLDSAGSAVKFSLLDRSGSERKVIVVHTRDQEMVAFEDRCTHKGTELVYLPGENVLACSGLSSRFDLAGTVIRKPAEDPLRQYKARIVGHQLHISI